MRDLAQRLNDLCDALPFQTSWYLKDLTTGATSDRRGDVPVPSASTRKISIMMAALAAVHAGKLSLDQKVTVEAKYQDNDSGTFQHLTPGFWITFRDALVMMIIVSDNTATDMLFEKVGGVEPVNKLMQSYGLNTIKATGPSDTWFKALRAEPDLWKFHTEGKTPYGLSSPRDMGRLLEKIHKGEAVSKQASEQMLQIMRGQVYSSRLPKYVTSFRVPHKTGDFLPYIGNDVGILESPNRHIVISVFTARHNGIGPNLEDAIGRIGEQVANYFAYRESGAK